MLFVIIFALTLGEVLLMFVKKKQSAVQLVIARWDLDQPRVEAK